MNSEQIKNSIACCGLICILCSKDGSCDCHAQNCCGKRTSPIGCYQYNCCAEKGLNGCWECDIAPCGQDMLAADKMKLRAFITYIREYGLQNFSESIINNINKGVVYHKNGIYGDYDLKTEQEVLDLLKNSK